MFVFRSSLFVFLFHPVSDLLTYIIFFLGFVRLPKSDICKASIGSAVFFFFCLSLWYHTFLSMGEGGSSTSLVLSDFVSVLLDVFFFSSFVQHFHFQLQFSVVRRWLTDWSSVGLWAYFSESLSVLSLLPLFSLSDTIKQKHISKSSERGIFLSFLFTPVCLVFCRHCLFLFSVSITK